VGQYRKNTVLGVLAAERPELGSFLASTYRLDKPVSGLLVLARNPAAAARMTRRLRVRVGEGDVAL
jgi:tRNA pseudouridine32 synthase